MEGLLYLENGAAFEGRGFGAAKTMVGELVFNTSMTGYQKILTDPSYKGQIINMTYPLMGNYGISDCDMESAGIHAFGLVARDVTVHPSSHLSVRGLDDWLKQQQVPGVSGVDTRMLTKRIRHDGCVKCVISTEGIGKAEAQSLCAAASLRQDWMKETGVQEISRRAGSGPRVAVFDFGIKESILCALQARGCDLYLFPCSTPAEEILAVKPDGVFLSNGPGDPAAAREAVAETAKLIGRRPLFGVCMGHQILAMAVGGKTYRMKYGHRGGNHGVKDLETGRSVVTAQNHGYAVDEESIVARGMAVTHRNLNDQTVEGMRHKSLPLFSVQYHPEASPGPNDSTFLFDRFLEMMEKGEAGQ